MYYANQIDYSLLPGHMQNSMKRYIEYGIEPGGFLYAVLTNDLMGAISKADYINQQSLHLYALFLYNNVPCSCFGSEEAVANWLSMGGIQGLSCKDKEDN